MGPLFPPPLHYGKSCTTRAYRINIFSLFLSLETSNGIRLHRSPPLIDQTAHSADGQPYHIQRTHSNAHSLQLSLWSSRFFSLFFSFLLLLHHHASNTQKKWWLSLGRLDPRVQERSPHAHGQARAVQRPEVVVPSHPEHADHGRQEIFHGTDHRRRQRRVDARTHDYRVLKDRTCSKDGGWGYGGGGERRPHVTHLNYYYYYFYVGEAGCYSGQYKTPKDGINHDASSRTSVRALLSTFPDFGGYQDDCDSRIKPGRGVDTGETQASACPEWK